jgi:quinol monooxygenase YgiN
MIAVIARINVIPGKEAEWEEIFVGRRAWVLEQEPDCLGYDMYRAETPGEYVVIERFTSRDAFQAHLKGSVGHEKMIACFAKTPVNEFVEAVDGCANLVR